MISTAIMGTVVFPMIHGRQYGMVIAPPVFSLFSIVAVALRFLARRLAQRRPDASDYTLLVALVMSVAYSGLNMAECIIGGGGFHVSELVALGGSLVNFQKVSLLFEIASGGLPVFRTSHANDFPIERSA